MNVRCRRKPGDVMARLLSVFTFLMVVAGCSTTPTPMEPLSGAQLVKQVPSPIYMRQNIYHEVGPMETLWRIGKMYGVNQTDIIAANHLRDPSAISVGQKLLIPNAQKSRAVIPLYQGRPWAYIVIHHSATSGGNALFIDRIHHQKGWWNGMGYHFLIDNGTSGKDAGQIEIGPRWIKQMDGAHCNAANMNENGIGICLIGNFSKERVSRPEMDSLVFLVNLLRKHYRIPMDHIIGHRDVPGKSTECPGNYFPWNEFKRRLTEAGD